MGFYADAAAAIADNCRHYYSVNEAGGTVLADSLNVGGAFDLNLSNLNYSGDILNTIIDSPLGKARNTAFGDAITLENYTGYETYFSNADALTIHAEGYEWISENFSYRARFMLREIPATDWPMIFQNNQSGTVSDRSFSLWVEAGTGKVNLYFPFGSIDHYSNFVVTADQWVDVVVTCSPAGGKLYINGALDSSFPATSIKPYRTVRWLYGALYNYRFWRGYIDEFALWERELTSAQVLSISSQQLIGGSAGSVSQALAVQWNLGELLTVAQTLGVKWDITPELIATPVDLAPMAEAATYRATLTGAADGLADLILPMSSFNAKLSAGIDSYLSVIVPGGAHIEGIEGRANGDLIVEQVVAGMATEIARAAFAELRIDKGARAGTTLSLSAKEIKTYDAPGSWLFENYSYYSRSGNKSRIRMQANAAVKPGDTINANGLSFIVSTITIIGSTNRVYMEIAE